ncbi:11044_t:CDS:2 [Funneliformis mosseae]|uniref:11044_t:CDS:1 n=1 Tax=Funneliformis mosseae TaxID=27381 RepID=A0A9N9DU04_FUNMO|nr:11044_t:CDS:2 [Funneliformis mosseae]
MTSRVRNASSSSSLEIPNSINYADNSIKFQLKTHGVITFTQLMLSTLCLFHFPQHKLFENSVESLKTTNISLFFIQFTIEIIRWFVYLDSDANNVGYETKKKFKNLFNDFIKKKGKNFFVALYLTAFAAFVLHLVSVLFGIFPPAVAFNTHGPYWSRVFSDFNPETIPEKMVYYSTVGTIIGAWAGAIVIPLDWDRPWQVWPISCVLSSYIGHVVGSILSLIVCYFNPESSALQKKRE